MHLIQSLKNEFCFDLPMFSKYPATSINSYFYKMTLELDAVQTLTDYSYSVVSIFWGRSPDSALPSSIV